MTEARDTTKKEVWVAPEIRTLDVAETQRLSGRGRDGGNYGIDCTRS